MEQFRVHILGCGSALPTLHHMASSQVVELRDKQFMVDCGEGTQLQVRRSRINFNKIQAVFISHIHGDHVFGLPGLLSTMGMLSRIRPLSIYAPANFGPLLKFFLSYYGEGLAFEVRHIPLTMREPEVIYHTKSLEISAFPLNHVIETFGFLFREKEPQFNVKKWKIGEYGLSLTEIAAVKRGEDVVREMPDGSCLTLPFEELGYKPFEPRSYAYCSDTAPFPEEADWVRGVNLLYHESTYLDELSDLAVARHHSTTSQAARCASEAGVGKLVIGHYSSRVKDVARYEAECRSIFPETYAASDLDVFDIPLQKNYLYL